MPVDLNVPEGIPVTGVLTSDNGTIYFAGREIMKIQRGFIRFTNGLRVFRPAGTRIGTVYAGQQAVRGQITSALLNFAFPRFLMGAKPGATLDQQTFQPGPGVLTAAQVTELLAKAQNMPFDQSADHFYPFRVDIEMVVNKQQIAVTSTTPDDGMDGDLLGSEYAKESSVIAKNCIINNYVIAYDSRGHIVSGPLDFVGSAVQWKHDSELIT